MHSVQALEEILHISVFYYVFPGHGWDISIREMAVAAIKLEILSAAPYSEVSIVGLQPVLNMEIIVISECKLLKLLNL